MKKVISLIVFLAVVLCSFTGFAEKDPAVGMWYIFTDFDKYPELNNDTTDEYNSILLVYVFHENGGISQGAIGVIGETAELDPIVKGHWEKTDTGYNFRMLGLGEGTFSIDGDDMYLGLEESGFSIRFHRAIPLNPYKDYIY